MTLGAQQQQIHQDFQVLNKSHQRVISEKDELQRARDALLDERNAHLIRIEDLVIYTYLFPYFQLLAPEKK